MVDRSIKVDERTDRLVTDLAYFLRSSKKSIVRDAVAEFAETHHPRSSGSSERGGRGSATWRPRREQRTQFAEECVASPAASAEAAGSRDRRRVRSTGGGEREEVPGRAA